VIRKEDNRLKQNDPGTAERGLMDYPSLNSTAEFTSEILPSEKRQKFFENLKKSVDKGV
jgi:hypothetical protein